MNPIAFEYRRHFIARILIWWVVAIGSLTGGSAMFARTTFHIPDGDVPALIAAINAAVDGDTIVLSLNGLYTLDTVNNMRNGPNGLPVIRRAIKIDGNGATIERQIEAPDFRILYLQDVGPDTELVNLGVRNGLLYECQGAGMYIENSNPSIDRCLFEKNETLFTSGGALYNDNSSPTIRRSVFWGNATDGAGGAICNTGTSRAMIENCLFALNSAYARGGAIYNGADSQATITGSDFWGNFATDDGGGIYNFRNESITRDCLFENNSADWGGAVFNDGGAPVIADCVFEGNRSDYGGAIRNENGSQPEITRCAFRKNEGGLSGGAIWNGNECQPKITHCVFKENESERGGAIANAGHWSLPNTGSSATITDCVFEANQAGDEGGGVANFDGSHSTVTDSSFSGNKAATGGGIFSDEESSSGVGATFFCRNEPDDIAGPWTDLGANRFGVARWYYEWVRIHFDPSCWDDAAITGISAAPAGDRLPNLLKYALGFEPWQPRGGALPLPEVQTLPGQENERYLTLTFSHPSGLSDMVYDVQLSDDLTGWTESAVLVSSVDDGSTIRRTYRDTKPYSVSGQRFIRLKVTQP